MKLNEICEVYSGYALKKFNDIKDGMPVVKIGNIHVDGTLNLEMCQYTTEDVDKKYYSNKGDVYIALSGATTGKVGIMDTDDTYVINQRVGIIRQKNNGIPQEYIKYFLLRQTDRIFKEATGCAQPNISPKQIADYIVPDISKEKMYEICGIFNKIKKIIDSRNAEISALDNLIKARFVEMFGACKNMLSMNELCSVITDGTHQPPKFQKSGIPFIFVSNLANNTVTYDTEKFISQETYSELYKRTPIEIGDLLLSTVGSYGHPAVVVIDKKFLFQRHIAYLKPKCNIVNSFYLHSALLAPDGQRQIEGKVKGIAQKTLNLSEIKKIVVPIPPIEEQNEFERFVHQVDKSKVVYMYILKTRKYLMYNSKYREKVNCI